METMTPPNVALRDFRTAAQEALDTLSIALGVPIDATLTLKMKQTECRTRRQLFRCTAFRSLRLIMGDQDAEP